MGTAVRAATVIIEVLTPGQSVILVLATTGKGAGEQHLLRQLSEQACCQQVPLVQNSGSLAGWPQPTRACDSSNFSKAT